jgi:uncharacterized membrane protein YagU involved in acid resistance
VNFLSLAQNANIKLQVLLNTYTKKLSFFFWTGLIAGLVDALVVAKVELPIDFPEPESNILL